MKINKCHILLCIPAIASPSFVFAALSYKAVLNPVLSVLSAFIFSISGISSYSAMLSLGRKEHRKAQYLLLLSASLSIASVFILELMLFNVRAYNSMFSFIPELAVLSSPAALYLASALRIDFIDRKKISPLLSLLVMAAVSIALQCIFYYVASFAYIYMAVRHYRLYSALAVSSVILFSLSALIVIYCRKGKYARSLLYILLILSLLIEFTMNFLEFDEGRLAGAVLSGNALEQYTAASLAAAIVFIFFSSYSASIILSAFFIIPSLPQKEIMIKEQHTEAVAVSENRSSKASDPEFEIPPNVPKRRSAIGQ